MFKMVLANFQVENKLRRARFFQEKFLLADFCIKVVLKILFLIISKVDVSFVEQKFTWKFCTTAKALPTTKKVEIFIKKKFTKAALDEKSKAFVVHITSFYFDLMLIDLA